MQSCKPIVCVIADVVLMVVGDVLLMQCACETVVGAN